MCFHFMAWPPRPTSLGLSPTVMDVVSAPNFCLVSGDLNSSYGTSTWEMVLQIFALIWFPISMNSLKHASSLTIFPYSNLLG